jgi:hypothetical protein
VSIKRYYFITSGVVSHIAIVILVLLLAKHYDLTTGQFFYRISEEIGVKSQLIDNAAFTNNFDFPSSYFIPPTLIDKPRILSQVQQFVSGQLSISDFPQGELKKYNPCNGRDLFSYTACSLLTKDNKAKEEAKYLTLQFKVNLPNASGHYANGWQLAFAYDSLKHIVNYSEAEKHHINEKLSLALKHYLLLLNGDSASLWHGRTTLAAQMWLIVLALDEIEQSTMERTTPHFYSMVEALSMTQAWPEGYNYWINSRAFHVVLALSGYINGTKNDHWHDKIHYLLNKVGRWHIQASRPDWQIEPLGDEGPRLDLKDESRRVIDIIAQTTQNPIFLEYSKKLALLHGSASYYASYRWGWSLFYPMKLESNAIAKLPLMEIFGKEFFGQSYIRENWQDNATFISYRAGSSFTHHGHYDNGHVSLFKEAPLLMNSSVPGGYFSENRLNYGIRTVAKNSLLIQRENEKVKIGLNKDNYVSDGGQRVTMPLGSSITTVKDWFEQKVKGPVLAGGSILLSDHSLMYSYIKSDLTKSYNSDWYDDNNDGGKLELVERELLYLREQDVLLIKDTVNTKNNNQVKVIFHTMNKPIVQDESVLKGESNNGILSTQSKQLKVKNANGFLTTEVIADINDIRLIGGNDYKFYVENDGDDTKLDGENYNQGLTERQIENAPGWRIEINGKKKPHQEFITIHRPSIGDYRQGKTSQIIIDDIDFYIIGNTAIAFTDKIISRENMMVLNNKNILLCGIKKEKQSACLVINDISPSKRL